MSKVPYLFSLAKITDEKTVRRLTILLPDYAAWVKPGAAQLRDASVKSRLSDFELKATVYLADLAEALPDDMPASQAYEARERLDREAVNGQGVIDELSEFELLLRRAPKLPNLEAHKNASDLKAIALNEWLSFENLSVAQATLLSLGLNPYLSYDAEFIAKKQAEPQFQERTFEFEAIATLRGVVFGDDFKSHVLTRPTLYPPAIRQFIRDNFDFWETDASGSRKSYAFSAKANQQADGAKHQAAKGQNDRLTSAYKVIAGLCVSAFNSNELPTSDDRRGLLGDIAQHGLSLADKTLRKVIEEAFQTLPELNEAYEIGKRAEQSTSKPFGQDVVFDDTDPFGKASVAQRGSLDDDIPF